MTTERSAAPSSDGPPGALAGVRVVEVAGPLGEWCGRLLATMGADVIKVEPPGGAESRRHGPFAGDVPDPNRSLTFWHTNAGKRSAVLDFTSPDGVARLRRLVAGADVLVETLPPAEARRLGLFGDEPLSLNPALVVCSLSPFGPDGPYAELQTTDLIAMALGGPMQSCGYDADDGDLPPVRPGENHPAFVTGHFAVTGILAALLEREESGRGQRIDVAAHDCLSVTVEFANTHWYYGQGVLRRQTGRHAGAQPTARTQQRCADGRYVNLALPRDNRVWQSLVDTLAARGLADGLDDPALANPDTRMAQAGRVYDLLQVMCATMTADEVFHMGQRLGLTWGAVRAPEDWLDDRHAAARGFFQQVEHPELGAAFPYPVRLFHAGASPVSIRRRAPLLGEDTADVLRELD